MPSISRFVAPDFLALTIGIVVFFVGVLITQRISFLRNYNIPEPRECASVRSGRGRGAVVFGLPPAAGVVIGSVALVGGHGTAIAWGPTIAEEHGFPAALETGIAVATLGLIIASLLGGPLSKLLIERHGLAPRPEDVPPGQLPPESDAAPIDKMGVMRAMLAVNVAVILGSSCTAGSRTPAG